MRNDTLVIVAGIFESTPIRQGDGAVSLHRIRNNIPGDDLGPFALPSVFVAKS